jgi:hypothetical protein
MSDGRVLCSIDLIRLVRRRRQSGFGEFPGDERPKDFRMSVESFRGPQAVPGLRELRAASTASVVTGMQATVRWLRRERVRDREEGRVSGG